MPRPPLSQATVLTHEALGHPESLKGKRSVAVRLYRAGRVGHDEQAGAPGQWQRAVTSLRLAANMPTVQVELRMPLTATAVSDAEDFARLLALLAGVVWVIEVPPDLPDREFFGRMKVVGMMAEKHGVPLRLHEPHGELDGLEAIPSHTLTESSLGLIRQGGFWAAQGSKVSVPETGPEFASTWRKGASLGNLGFEVSLRGYPVDNLPACLGGRSRAQSRGETLFGAGCTRCGQREGCQGVPKSLALALTNDSEVEPLPLWTGMFSGALIYVSKDVEGPLLARLYAMEALFHERGLVLTGQPQLADFVLLPNVDALLKHLGKGGRTDQRVLCFDVEEAVDFTGLAARFDPHGRRHRGVDWWPGPEVVLLSTDPRKVEMYRDWGFPLRWIHFLHWPVQLQFEGLPLSTGQIFRPETWMGEADFHERASRADLVVLAHLHGDALNLAYATAFGAGRAVVGRSDRLGRWWVDHGRNGWLVRQEVDLESVVTELIDTPELLARMTLQARKWARTLSLSTVAQGLVHGLGR